MIFAYIASELQAKGLRSRIWMVCLDYEKCDVQQSLMKAEKSLDERQGED